MGANIKILAMKKNEITVFVLILMASYLSYRSVLTNKCRKDLYDIFQIQSHDD
ncbi:hypothetical protein AAEX28_03915 [Lentisphaerota bacterium WC36G]|nr:hypothetical protein LJT99_06790 [Lentisphaerae bacterium WC36]